MGRSRFLSLKTSAALLGSTTTTATFARPVIYLFLESISRINYNKQQCSYTICANICMGRKRRLPDNYGSAVFACTASWLLGFPATWVCPIYLTNVLTLPYHTSTSHQSYSLQCAKAFKHNIGKKSIPN